MDRLNYKDKSVWSMENASRIAEEFHYVPDANFMRALSKMIEMAQSATVVELLGSVAQGLFVSWKPPLEVVPPHVPAPPRIETPPAAPSAPPKAGNIFTHIRKIIPFR